MGRQSEGLPRSSPTSHRLLQMSKSEMFPDTLSFVVDGERFAVQSCISLCTRLADGAFFRRASVELVFKSHLSAWQLDQCLFLFDSKESSTLRFCKCVSYSIVSDVQSFEKRSRFVLDFCARDKIIPRYFISGHGM
jgi:hypothetical protein